MTAIEVPGEPTLFRSFNIPPERVTLPLALHARVGWLMLVQLAAFLALALPLSPLLFVPVALARDLLAASTLGALFNVMLWTPLALVLVAFAICPWAVVVTMILDAFRQGPVLILHEEGLMDRRSSGEFIRWSEMEHAKVLYTQVGMSGVRLSLRRELLAGWNPFRPGTLGFVWRRKPHELYVPILFLDRREHMIGHAIAELVKRAGGKVEMHP